MPTLKYICWYILLHNVDTLLHNDKYMTQIVFLVFTDWCIVGFLDKLLLWFISMLRGVFLACKAVLFFATRSALCSTYSYMWGDPLKNIYFVVYTQIVWCDGLNWRFRVKQLFLRLMVWVTFVAALQILLLFLRQSWVCYFLLQYNAKIVYNVFLHQYFHFHSRVIRPYNLQILNLRVSFIDSICYKTVVGVSFFFFISGMKERLVLTIWYYVSVISGQSGSI